MAGQQTEKQYRGNTIIFGRNPQLPYSVEEAVNRLRVNISFLGSDVRKIMIVSSEPNEGKSFVTLNMWKQMSDAGSNSVLVDADMRNSNMLSKYELSRADGEEIKGTSHYLAGSAELGQVLMHSSYCKGDILPNAENIINPSLLLETNKFGQLLDNLAEFYNYVFIDAPPLGIVSDGERIGSMCDGAILVIRSNMTPRGLVRDSVRQLERANCPLLGVVLNRVSESKGHYGKYGHYGHYGYYGRYGRYGGYYGGEYYGSGKD